MGRVRDVGDQAWVGCVRVKRLTAVLCPLGLCACPSPSLSLLPQPGAKGRLRVRVRAETSLGPSKGHDG